MIITTGSMYSSRQLGGVLLFSSVILITVANIHIPFSRMWANRRQVVVNNFRIGRKQSMRLSPKDTTEGELIVSGDREYVTGMWKRKSSPNIRECEEEGDNGCELEIVNNLEENVLLCWVTSDGALKHFRPLNDKSIRDGSVSNVHIEYTFVGDHFVCIRNSDSLPSLLCDVSDEAFIFSYTPLKPNSRHSVTLEPKRKRSWFFTGGASRRVDIHWKCSPIESADVIDTSAKPYNCTVINGFKVMYESDVFESVSGFETVLRGDIKQLVSRLPAKACELLQKTTCLYVNKTLTYGKVSNPVIATSCCYHPLGDSEWLRNNGLNVCKEGNVEIANASSYMETRRHWGEGGVLVHEFSHVFHDKCCPNGYECEDVRNAYNQAMKTGLYDRVKVHGPQGAQSPDGKAKAYACTNCMEFFAELSVAYHYNDDGDMEYNKWFPFNRQQLMEYDRKSYDVLAKLWNAHE